jgi:hypothetical protein
MNKINFNLHKIFVEGSTDKGFLVFLFEKYGISFDSNEQVNNAIIDCNGYTNISKQTGILKDKFRIENGGKNLIIFDADSNRNNGGLEKRKNYLLGESKKIGVDFEIFLFPNNKSDGDLEDFYCAFFKKDLSFFNGCWDGMINCLKENKNDLTLKLPYAHEKVFSYVDLFESYKKGEYKNTKTKRSYFDEGLWEFDFINNENLKELCNFLEINLGISPIKDE